MKFIYLLVVCFGLSIDVCSQVSQNKSVNSKQIVFLCDSTSNDVGLTVIDGIPYLHNSKQDLMSLIDPTKIKVVSVEVLKNLAKDTYHFMTRYANLMKVGRFLSVTTVDGRGLKLNSSSE